MSREVLLTLLGTLLVLNVGVLISIGLLSRRARGRRAEPVSTGAARQAETPIVSIAVTVPAIGSGLLETPAEAPALKLGASEAPAPHVEAPARDVEASMPDVEASMPDVEAAVASVGNARRRVLAEPVVSVARVTSAVEAEVRGESGIGVGVIDAPPQETLVAGNGHVRHGVDPVLPVDPVDPVDHPTYAGAEAEAIESTTARMRRKGVPSTSAGGKRRRSRRFVLPPLEEDGDRSARAIEAFLGEASISPPVAHPERSHRRRHRARRAHGAKTTRTSLVVDLVGYDQLAATAGADQAARLAGAVAEALWRSARIGDEVRELAPGQIQLVLDCDAAGADAFAARASATVAPWLGAMPVAVQARIAPAPIAPAPIAPASIEESPSARPGSIPAHR
jgi:hypothetical protein